MIKDSNSFRVRVAKRELEKHRAKLETLKNHLEAEGVDGDPLEIAKQLLLKQVEAKTKELLKSMGMVIPDEFDCIVKTEEIRTEIMVLKDGIITVSLPVKISNCLNRMTSYG